MTGRMVNCSCCSESQQEMELSIWMIWADITVCLPFSLLILCCVVKKDQVAAIYYTNLLVTNLIQICIKIVQTAKLGEDQTSDVILYVCVLANAYFKICIALDRCLFITWPLLDCVRQTKGSVVVCALVWILCIITAPLDIFLKGSVTLYIFSISPSICFIFSIILTLLALPAATSVPTEEKRRIVGILILLLLNYFLNIFPTLIFLTLKLKIPDVVLILLWLSHFVDLILGFFMQKGPIDKVLTRLCCCSFKNTPTADIEADDQQQVHVVRHTGQERQGEDSGQDDEKVEI